MQSIFQEDLPVDASKSRLGACAATPIASYGGRRHVITVIIGGEMLPNFVCPGAARSATTTLYYMLIQHPQIFLPSIKETRFFALDYDKGLSWYEQKYYSNARNEIAVGDISPAYLMHEKCSERIFRALGPEIKFIFMLRNPVDRAYSHYCMLRNHQFEDLSFEEAISIGDNDRIKKSFKYYGHENGYQYLKEGNYSRHILKYLEYFPIERIKIVIFEEFITDVAKHMANIVRFLGAQDSFCFDARVYKNQKSISQSNKINRLFYCNPLIKKTRDFVQMNTGWRIQSSLKKLKNTLLTKRDIDIPPLNENTQKQLYNYFEDEITRLESLLGKDLSVWRKQ